MQIQDPVSLNNAAIYKYKHTTRHRVIVKGCLITNLIAIFFRRKTSSASLFEWDFPTLCRERRYFFLYLFVYESQVFVTWSVLGRERTLGMRPWE